MGPISQSALNSRAGQMMHRPSLGPSRAPDGYPLKPSRQSLAGPAASCVSFGGNMAGSMLPKKNVTAASR